MMMCAYQLSSCSATDLASVLLCNGLIGVICRLVGCSPATPGVISVWIGCSVQDSLESQLCSAPLGTSRTWEASNRPHVVTRKPLKCLKLVLLSQLINFSSKKDGFLRFYRFVVWLSVYYSYDRDERLIFSACGPTDFLYANTYTNLTCIQRSHVQSCYAVMQFINRFRQIQASAD